MDYVYCVFCNMIDRHRIAKLLEMQFHVEVLVPMIIQRKWVKGVVQEVLREYLPGYLFLFSAAPLHDFALIRAVSGVHRILGCRENEYCLTGQDLAFAELLRSTGGVIRTLKAFREGDSIQLAEGAMGAVRGKILQLDRRGRALVRFSFDNADVQSWVAIDILKEDAT